MRQDLHYKETLFFIQQSSILHRKVGLCVYSNIIFLLTHTHYLLLIIMRSFFPLSAVSFFSMLNPHRKKDAAPIGAREQDR